MPCRTLTVLLTALLAGTAVAQPPAPPPPDEYDVRIRYEINAYGVDRIGQYEDMLTTLKKGGFKRNPNEPFDENEREDILADRMSGTVKSEDVPRLFADQHVRTLQLLPKGAKLPARDMPVRVNLTLTSGLNPAGQLRLWLQVKQILGGVGFEDDLDLTPWPPDFPAARFLRGFGFKEAIGYDHRGHTRLVGSIPVESLDLLFNDTQRRRWFLVTHWPTVAPLSSMTPIRVVEVLPDQPPPFARPTPPQVAPAEANLSPELRALLSNADEKDKPRRLEVILALPPDFEQNVRNRIAAVPNVSIEGRLGTVFTITAPPTMALEIAKRDIVAGVRTARVARDVLPADVTKEPDLMRALKCLPPPRPKPVSKATPRHHVLVLDADFRGWEAQRGKGLPADVRFIDLTREYNQTLLPDPYPAPQEGPGVGTLFAVSLVKQVPNLELTLVRIDLASPHMIETVGRAIGTDYRSLALNLRRDEIAADQVRLNERKAILLDERKAVLKEFNLEYDPPFEQPVEKIVDEGKVPLDALIKLPEFERLSGSGKRRILYRYNQKRYDADAQELTNREARYFRHVRDTTALRGAGVVISGPVWNDGYPVRGSSSLSRWFDDRPFREAVWLQAVGNPRAQTWTGPFRDTDANGVMEFAAAATPLPRGRWTRELNFLGWQPRQGDVADDLPAATRLRVSLQWREAHDPDFLRVGEDPYRQSLADMRVVVLYQPDPSGAKQPADEFEVVAQSIGPALRLSKDASSGTYEVSVLVDASKPGRYVVRIEGRQPDGILPRNMPSLPASKKYAELRPRLFVETLQGDGRAVLRDFSAEEAEYGMPGDARHVLPVAKEE